MERAAATSSAVQPAVVISVTFRRADPPPTFAQTATGELVVLTADFRASVLPVLVSQAAPDEEEGVYVNDDGDVVFVAVNRRVVLSYPTLVNAPAFMDVLATLGLQLDFSDRNNLVVAPLSGTSGNVSEMIFANGDRQLLFVFE